MNILHERSVCAGQNTCCRHPAYATPHGGYDLGAISAFMMWPACKASNAVSASGSGVMTLVSSSTASWPVAGIVMARSNSSV
jgi:hypothetical protein